MNGLLLPNQVHWADATFVEEEENVKLNHHWSPHCERLSRYMYNITVIPQSTSCLFKRNYDTTFTSLGEDVTGSSVVRSSLLASLVACLMASLYGPRFFLLYLVCENGETQSCIMKCKRIL